MPLWSRPSRRQRAVPTTPVHEPEKPSQLDADIEHARERRDLLQLSTLLRRRFFMSGQAADIREALAISINVPPSILGDVGTSLKPFRPELNPREHVWVQWQPWLEAQGYELLQRYSPDWVPTWVADPTKNRSNCEDGSSNPLDNVNAAVRLTDRVTVWLKLCYEAYDDEIRTNIYFATEPQRSDPRNHCCPLLDVLHPPLVNGKRYCILVTPLLRAMNVEPQPETVQDFLDCVLQLAEGLDFMHEHNVAHRDIHHRNAMFDGSKHIPNGWHPFCDVQSYPSPSGPSAWLQVFPYSHSPVKFYYIDFGFSVRFSSKLTRRLVLGTAAMDRTVPELSNTTPYDPFATDIRMFGDMIKELQEGYARLRFLKPFVAKLVPDDPASRLDAPDMLRALRTLIAKQPRWRLVLPLARRRSSDAKIVLDYLLRLTSLSR